ncbi:hypothetical protein [Pseudoponticoccus marisrubri]|uniref:Glyceraldehyde-3-phosphate dehydrogenase n=1 Tax=Pseudoponticoccus marisrubri TaxID=1685382 RepID=A0A0W7WMQ4_9RHOB|nr:hypothetical protein [Pseudoponticoccus marisrubri]KUF11846.1 glyceraldehyde-3-phosphate dehydrogenase [Pseudoponticoccus marisrubri]
MTNPIAIVLGLILLGAVAADLVLWDGTNLVFVGKKLFSLIDWLAFWR